jgi:hypothetical protein
VVDLEEVVDKYLPLTKMVAVVVLVAGQVNMLELVLAVLVLLVKEIAVALVHLRVALVQAVVVLVQKVFSKPISIKVALVLQVLLAALLLPMLAAVAVEMTKTAMERQEV